METIVKRISLWVVGIGLPLVILFLSIEIATFDRGFYEREFEKHRVSQNTGIQGEELKDITEDLLSYLRGKRGDLEIYGKVHGRERLIFDERDRAHMVDVQDLFLKGFILKRVTLVLLVIALGTLWIKGHRYELARTIGRSALVWAGVVILLGLIIATNFSRYFDIFHYIFFDNDLWRLDPKKSILINLVPLGFFIDITIRIAIYFFGGLGLCTLLSMYYLKRNRLGFFKN